MDFFMEKEHSNGQMAHYIKESSKIMKLLEMAVTNGLINHGMKDKLRMDLGMELGNMSIRKRKWSIRVNGWMA